jgi:ribosomal protein S27E
MKIRCVACGHNFNLDDEVYGDYEGQVMCYICGGLLEIQMEKGKLKALQLFPAHKVFPGKEGAGQSSGSGY